jgi:hypothetical protein
MDWLTAVANALSLAFGVAFGSFISYYLLRKETSGLIKKFMETEFFVRVNNVLREANEVLASEEARLFFRRLNELLEAFVKGEMQHQPKRLIELPKLPLERQTVES